MSDSGIKSRFIKKAGMKNRILSSILFLFLLISGQCFPQAHFYIGRSFGMYQHFQGPLETRAWLFNNYTDVKKEMNPNRLNGGIVLGTNMTIGRSVFGLEFCGKNNRFSGTREGLGIKITDQYNEKLNVFYVNYGLGNKIGYSELNETKFIYRAQVGVGFYSFKLKEDRKGFDDFSGTVGSRKGISFRFGLYTLMKLTNHIYLNVVPYYEMDTGGGYVEILEDKLKQSEFFNITNLGVNINLNYAF